MSITRIRARQIFDSRGNPTVEVDVLTHKGVFRAAVPSGASTGAHEAVELRDNVASSYRGKAVLQAVRNVNEIIGPALHKASLKVTDQEDVDELLKKLDGTPNKSKLGANAIVGVSLAIAKAGAGEKNIPLYQHFAELAGVQAPYVLPTPCFNVINGGKHAGNELAFQEFMIIPIGASSFQEAMMYATDTYHALKKVITAKYGINAVNVGDEGGFAPDIHTGEEALELISHAIKEAGYEGKVKIGMDAAASEFYKDGKYDLDFKNPNSDPSKWLTGEQLAELYFGFVEKYNMVFVEDPFDEDDWESFSKFMAKAKFQVIADDLTVTNPIRIKTAIEQNCANCLLLKVNQIGTVTESIQAAKLAQSAGWGVMVSHRSGETEDTFIADLVVGLGVGQIKTGAPARSERVAKYNALLRIEEELGGFSSFAGVKAFAVDGQPPELLVEKRS